MSEFIKRGFFQQQSILFDAPITFSLFPFKYFFRILLVPLIDVPIKAGLNDSPATIKRTPAKINSIPIPKRSVNTSLILQLR